MTKDRDFAEKFPRRLTRKKKNEIVKIYMAEVSPEPLGKSRAETPREEYLNTIHAFEGRRNSLPPDARNAFAAIITGSDGDERLIFSQPAVWTDEKGAQNTGLVMVGPTGIDIMGLNTEIPGNAEGTKVLETFNLLTQISNARVEFGKPSMSSGIPVRSEADKRFLFSIPLKQRNFTNVEVMRTAIEGSWEEAKDGDQKKILIFQQLEKIASSLEVPKQTETPPQNFKSETKPLDTPRVPGYDVRRM